MSFSFFKKKRFAPLAVLFLFALVLLLFWISQRGSLEIESSHPEITVSATHCTVGTNHVYFFGNLIERLVSPFNKWMKRAPAEHQVQVSSAMTNTVIWVRFENNTTLPPPPPPGAPSGILLGFRTPNLFKAEIIDSNGVSSNLSLIASVRNYQSQSYIMGWMMNGPPDDHRKAKIRIQYINGPEVVTLRVR